MRPDSQSLQLRTDLITAATEGFDQKSCEEWHQAQTPAFGTERGRKQECHHLSKRSDTYESSRNRGSHVRQKQENDKDTQKLEDADYPGIDDLQQKH